MPKICEGLPLSLTYGTLVHFSQEIDDYGNSYVMLYIASSQLMPSIGMVLTHDQILNESKGKSAEKKPYNLKFKIPQDRQEITIGLEPGENYWIEYASGQGGLKSEAGKYVDYQAMSLREISKSLPDRWKELIKASQQRTTQPAAA